MSLLRPHWGRAFGRLLAGGLVALTVVVGCSGGEDPDEPPDPAPASMCLDEAREESSIPCPEASAAPDSQGLVEPQTVESSTVGKGVYLQRCVGCHAVDGSGIVGPDIRPGEVLEKYASAEAMEAIVRDGLGEMPEFGSKLTDPEIAAVVAFVRGGLG